MSTFNPALTSAFKPAWRPVWGLSAITDAIKALFASSQQGVWYDPSDLDTTKLTFRRNLLTRSEDFTDAVWNVGGAGSITKSTSALTVAITGTAREVGQVFTSVAGGAYTLRFEASSGTASACKVALSDRLSHANGRYFDLSTGTVSASTNILVGSNAVVTGTSAVLNVATGRYICSVSFTTANAASYFATIGVVDNVGTDSATAGKSINATFAQIESSSIATPYQKITDYFTEFLAAFPSHTLFQDVAGTTPVTAVEQPVGLMLDKRLGAVRGPELVTNGTFTTNSANWTALNGAILTTPSGELLVTASGAAFALAYQAITTIVGKYYEVTCNARNATSNNIGFHVGSTVAGVQNGLVTSTSGTNIPLKISFVATATVHYVHCALGSNTTGTGFFDDVSVKLLDGNHATQATAASRPVVSARVNKLLATDVLSTQSLTVAASSNILSFTGTGTITLSGASVAGPLVGTGAGNRVSLAFTPTAGLLTLTVTGSVTLAQLEDGSTATRYQSVVNASTYDTAGFPMYLRFDGVDDRMATAAIGFTSDKMTVWAGVRKLTDAAVGVICETGATVGPNGGNFVIHTQTAPVGYRIAVAGSAGAAFLSNDVSIFTSPISNVISGSMDIAAPTALPTRVNGVSPTSTVAGTMGSGTFTPQSLNIGSRTGPSLFFSGNLYSLIVRGAASSAAEIAVTERYVANKTGVTL